MNTNTVVEGGNCNECTGFLHYPKPEGCSCHIHPPCGACEAVRLTCIQCGWEEPEIERQPIDASKSYVMPPYKPFTGYEYDLGDGKRLYSVFYDGSPGSTMVFKGKIEGDVTAKEILEKLGDGTFGHRGPSICGDTFTYTKITD